MADDLETLLGEGAGQQPAVEQQAPQVEAEAPVEPQQETVPAATAEPTSGPAPLIEDGEKSALVAQAKDERRKRQDLERQVADLTQRFQQFSQQPQQQRQPELPQQAPERPDPFTDPVGAFEWQQQQFEDRLFNASVLMSRAMVSKEPDFEAAESAFFEAAKANPMLHAQLRSHPMPAQFAYEEGRKLLAQREIGADPAAYRAKLEAEIRAQLQAELGQTKPAQAQTPKASAPKSLAGTPSAQPRDPRGRFSGPASLDEILGG